MRATGPLARHRGGARQTLTIHHIASDDGFGETSVEERYVSVWCDGVPSAMCFGFGSERNVV